MAELKSYMVESEAGAQHYLAAGSGTPLVMLHGMGAVAATWTAVAEAFSDEYRVVIPDLAGHGASAPLQGELNFALQMAGLEAVRRAECTESPQPAILVGHSLGGWLACLLTFAHPESVRRVVLVNGPLLMPWPEGLSLQPRDHAGAAKLFDATRSSTSPPVSDAVLDAYIAYANAGPISRFVFDVETWKPYFLNDRLHDFPRPVDLIWGMEDKLVTFANAEIMLEQLPRARATRLEGCGHLPHFDCPQIFIAALREVLSRPAPGEDAP
jgi:pimeloyl-ACP methyl ester carboxylesterase